MMKALQLLLVWVMCAFPACADDTATEDAMPATNLYKLITAHQGWLNTSRPLTAEDLKGRIILLDFWTYCCINCMQVMPDLAWLEEKFGHDLTVIGVHSAKFKNERDSENIREAILRHHLTHPVVNDFDFSTWKAFGINAWPTFVLISPRGIIAQTYSGEGNRDAVARDIEKLRQQYKGQINTGPLPIALEKDKQPETFLSFPAKLAYGRYGDKDSAQALYIADSGHDRIVVVSLKGDVLATIGSGQPGFRDGDASSAQFHRPQGLLLAFPYLYVADTGNHALRQVDLAARKVSTLAGTGEQGHERDVKNAPALETPMASPWDIAFYPDEKHIVIAQAGLHQLWSYDMAAKTVSLLAGSGHESIEDGRLPGNALAQPSGLSPVGDTLYFVDAETSSLRRLKDGGVTTLIGSGLFDFGYKEGKQGAALMQHPLGLAADAKQVFVADSYNHSIRRYDMATKILSNYAGHGERGHQDGDLKAASFNEPNAILQAGDVLYVADTNNNAIRVVDMKGGKVSTLSIQEPPSPLATEFSEDLPNKEDIGTLRVKAGAQAKVDLTLQSGWHINKDAPSMLALFRMEPKPKAVASFGTDALVKRSVALPALDKGDYRLQATLYYCEDKAGSQCLIKSFDAPVQVAPEGKADIALKLN